MRARETIAYIRGMLDARTSLEAADRQVYDAIVAALAALAEQIEENERRAEDQQEHLEELAGEIAELREDLDEVVESFDGPQRGSSWTFGGSDEEDDSFSEEESLDEEDDEDEDLLDQYESCVCVHCGHVFFFAPDAYEDEEELQCPQCGRMFALRE